jgi:Concanavalin A-like lectin/glucanases superfamily
MPSLIYPFVQRQQFTGATQIISEKSNPLCRGLLYAFNPNNSSFTNFSFIDSINLAKWTQASAPPQAFVYGSINGGKGINFASGFSSFGMYLNCTNSGSGGGLAINDSAYNRPTQVTVAAIVRQISLSAGNRPFMAAKLYNNNSVAVLSSWGMCHRPGGGMSLEQNVLGTQIFGTSYTHPDSSQWFMSVGVFDGINMYLYCDGILRHTDAAGAIVYNASNGSADAVEIGAITAGPFAATEVDIALFFMWNRVLSAPEIAILNQNPWQVFQRNLSIPLGPSPGALLPIQPMPFTRTHFFVNENVVQL